MFFALYSQSGNVAMSEWWAEKKNTHIMDRNCTYSMEYRYYDQHKLRKMNLMQFTSAETSGPALRVGIA